MAVCTDTSADRPHLPLLQLIIDLWMATILNPFHDRLTHPLQSSIDVCKTITPNKFYIQKNAHIPLADGPPIDHRSMLHCYTPKSNIVHNAHTPMADPYTKAVSYIVECHGRLTQSPLLQSSIDLWKTITPHKFLIYIAQCIYTNGRLTPPLFQLNI